MQVRAELEVKRSVLHGLLSSDSPTSCADGVSCTGHGGKAELGQHKKSTRAAAAPAEAAWACWRLRLAARGHAVQP